MRERDGIRYGSGYPHLITHGRPHNHWYEIRVANEPPATPPHGDMFHFWGPGAIGSDGRLTVPGRELVRAGVVWKLGRQAKACIVWGPRSCTWLTETGPIDGQHPPVGEPPLQGDWRHIPVHTVPGSWVELPEGCHATYLFIRRLSPDHVELSPAENMILGCFHAPPLDGEPDPFADCYGADGSFAPPTSYRGMQVTEVTEDCVLGPPQPNGCGGRIVAPWPERVRSAAEAAAGLDQGQTLPPDLHARIWRAVDDGRSREFGTDVRRAP